MVEGEHVPTLNVVIRLYQVMVKVKEVIVTYVTDKQCMS